MDRPGLNRTSVGLKPELLLPAPLEQDHQPQSNQRGIETAKESRAGRDMDGEPQSNQRGIETRHSRTAASTWRGPQSNQRGIETGLLRL